MRTRAKTVFSPDLEQFELRVVATGGLASGVAPPVHAAAHHSHHPHHPAPAPAPIQAPAPAPPPVSDGTTNQAWVKLVNTTGQDIEYQIKLGPYANGRFQTFDIAAGSTQYRMSSLISHGHRVKADFAIQFGNGPITPLQTGISQHSAQGYYIFLDGNFQPYVSPFVRS